MVQPSSMGLPTSGPFGMKWSATQMPSQPASSLWRARSRTSDHGFVLLGQTLKRTGRP